MGWELKKLLVYYVHPAQQHSRANKALADSIRDLDGITFVDLYAEYPRFEIDVDKEQARLLDHDIYVFQHPLFWYACPALLKEWIDLVLERGFAYGHGGDKLKGKTWLQAITAAGPQEAYTEQGFQHFPLRTFLTPMEQTARLCGIKFLPPFALYESIKARQDGRIESHAEAYVDLLVALRDDQFDQNAASDQDILTVDILTGLIGQNGDG